jgi:predicted permease
MNLFSVLCFKFYRLLLGLYPADFRREWSDEVLRTLGRREAALGAGTVRRLRFWSREMAALVRTALGQRWAWARVADPGRVSSGIARGRRERTPATRGPGRWPPPAIEPIIRDLRFAVRQLLRRPGLTVAALVTLALGIGANTAVFSVVSGVLLEPLPYPAPDRLVRVYDRSPNFPRFPLAPAAFVDYRELDLPFSGIATFAVGNLQLAEGDRPEQLTGMQVSSEFFGLLGLEPILGRGFNRDEEITGNHRKVVLGYQFWQRRLDGDPGILGKTLELSGRTFTVVGVAHPDLQSPGGSFRSVAHGENVDIWRPLVFGPGELQRFSHYLNGVARLREGVSVEQAEASMTTIAAEVLAPYRPADLAADLWRIAVVPLSDDIVGPARTALLVLLGAAGLILLLACVNIAGVMLARAADRQGEIALRMAIGASRGHLIRQMLVEAAVVASLGGLAGVILGVVGLERLLAIAPEGLPRLYAIELDTRVLAFALGATALTAVSAGLAPALHTGHFDVADTLKETGVRAVRSAVRSRRVLVVSQVALAVILLVGAGLLLRSFVSLRRVDPGFTPEGVLTARISLPSARYPTSADRIRFFEELDTRLESLPGVEAGGISHALPWSGYDENSAFAIEGWQPPEGLWMSLRYHFVSPGFHEAIGVPLLEGRTLSASDDRSTDAPPVAVINETMARRYWWEQPGAGSPLGSRVRLFMDRPVTIVGVVGDVRDGPSSVEARPALFLPIFQWSHSDVAVALRTQRDPMSLAAPLREIVASIDAALPLTKVRPLSEIAGAKTASARFTALLVGLFAAVALVLAVVGLYGLLSYLVGQRRREMAVRMALGAERARVLRLVVTEGVVLAAVGLLCGLVGSTVLAQLVASLLFGVAPLDPTTIVGVVLGVLAVAGAACLLPAMRAASVEPIQAMR